MTALRWKKKPGQITEVDGVTWLNTGPMPPPWTWELWVRDHPEYPLGTLTRIGHTQGSGILPAILQKRYRENGFECAVVVVSTEPHRRGR